MFFSFCLCLNQVLILQRNNIGMRRLMFQLYTLNYRHKMKLLLFCFTWFASLLKRRPRRLFFCFHASMKPMVFVYHFPPSTFSFSHKSNFIIQLLSFFFFANLIIHMCENNRKCIIQFVQPHE